MKPIFGLLAAILIGALSACASTGGNGSSSGGGSQFFEVHQDGRIHVFYDSETYQQFLLLGETAFRITRIGAGPEGQTVVFGLAEADRIKTSGLPGMDIYDGKKKAKNLYAEFKTEDDLYILDKYEDVVTLRNGGMPVNIIEQSVKGPNGEKLYVSAASAKSLMAMFTLLNP